MNDSLYSLCSRCQTTAAADDRYCRFCGHPLGAQPVLAVDLYRTIVEAVPVGMFAVDASGRVLYWNRAMEECRGLPRREALGRTFFEVLPHLQPYTHRVMRVLDNALPLRLDQVEDDSGPEGMQSFWFAPVLLESGTAALLGVMEDITQKVRVDTQLIRSERLAAVGELAAGVAHNFNNIMAAVAGDAQLLKLLAEDENLPPPVVEATQQIYEETMRGGRLAHDLLSFARGAEPHLQRLQVNEVINDAVRLIKNHPDAKSVTIVVDLSEYVPFVEADPSQLHQVFFNIMLNALQAMPNGGLLTIGAGLRGHEREANTGVLDIKFHDSGNGIPRDVLKRIFDPFYSRRANGSMGSGLGLPVSLTMVKSLGGDIHITSAEGIGTTVTVSLPIVERRTAPRGVLKRQSQGRALIVDDDANVQRTLTTLLSRRGFDVVTATDGAEAVRRFEEAPADRRFSVVVTELLLPKLDGVTATHQIRSHDPEVPIVVLTGATDPQKLRDALEAGAQFGFSKPPNFAELLSVIECVAQPLEAEPAVLAGGGE